MSRKASTTRAEVAVFEQLTSHLHSLAEELGILAKKSPDGLLNKFKIAIVNERLEAANALLGDKHRPFKDFRLFDDASLPSASDVVVVLAQYITSLESWRSAHVVKRGYDWFWDTPELDYPASPPSRFKHKDSDGL